MSHQDNESTLIAPALLLFAAVAGFIASNSVIAPAYQALLDTPIAFRIGGLTLIDKSVLLLVNDGLMAVFFLFIGLELKREIVVGELSNLRKATLPIFAAIGGMVVPAAFYFAVNGRGAEASGWGIPMATDIAFALGVLAVLGSRVPSSLKVLLAAVAIVDDLGAIIVIAVFYTSHIDITYLAWALGCFALCLAANRLGVMKLSIYMLIGLPLWYFMLKSGVHATIAGVLLAMSIPLSSKRKETERVIEDIFSNEASPLDSPAVFLEKSLLKWIGLVIVPVFAFCNSGVSLGSFSFGTISLGIILGLVVGKPLGIVGAAYLAGKAKVAELPAGVSWNQMIGLGLLAGIGFTMSLFISSLAFTDANFNNEAKVAILIASLVAGSLGAALMLRSGKTA